MTSVLVVDDDAPLRFALRKALSRHGYSVEEVSRGDDAVAILKGSKPPDVALLDLRLEGGIDGLGVMRQVVSTPTRIIVMTGHGTVRAAVEAMRLGAFSFLEKPVDADVVRPIIDQAVNDRKRGSATANVPPLAGKSPAIEDVRRFIDRVGPTDETVTIYGETGTGKEIAARHLHMRSTRAEGAFVALNAACVPRELFESELFGHRRGAFTGATSDRAGLFRDADGGTLFIDELGELPLESQAKLLRALETRTIRPVGETHEIPVDVRIIAASNRDLWTEVRAGRFREDLFFRLQVLPLRLPALRERREDIAELAHEMFARVGAPQTVLDAEVVATLGAYAWPGNVRELLNVIRRAFLFAENGVVDAPLIRRMISASLFAQGEPIASGTRVEPGSQTASRNLAVLEREHIEHVLQELGGNVTRAAIALGIDRRTLQRKLKAYGLSDDEDDGQTRRS